MPVTPAVYGSNPPITGVYGNAVYGRTAIQATFVIPFEAEGYRLGPGFDVLFYETINRGASVPQLIGV